MGLNDRMAASLPAMYDALGEDATIDGDPVKVIRSGNDLIDAYEFRRFRIMADGAPEVTEGSTLVIGDETYTVTSAKEDFDGLEIHIGVS